MLSLTHYPQVLHFGTGRLRTKSHVTNRGVKCFVARKDGGFSVQEHVDEDMPANPICLTSMMSCYNAIAILEVPADSPSEMAGARLLLLDQTGNVHSVYKEDSQWVGPYWDEFSSLPPIIPEGPIGILGLGGGTAARLLLHLWPERQLIGWEIDEILLDKARVYLGLDKLEGVNAQGGGLRVHVGDALSTENDPEDGFAGLIVDLFSEGEVLPVLNEPETWFRLKKRLRQGGRIMINCVEDSDDGSDEDFTKRQEKQGVLHAMLQAFPGEVNWRKIEKVNNKMAFTGPLPHLQNWSHSVPERLREGVLKWQPFS